MAMAWSVLEEGTREKKEKTEKRQSKEEEKEREREREACAAGHHNVFWLLRSLRSFLYTSVRLSVVCPGYSSRVHSRLAPVEGL